MAGQTRINLKRWGAPFLLLIATLALTISSQQSASQPASVHGAVYDWIDQNPGESVSVVVRTSSGESTADLSEQVALLGGEVNREFEIVSSIEATIPAESVPYVASLPSAGHISLNAPVVTAGFVDEANVATTYQRTVQADQVWDQGISGTGVGVAVIDTGISPTGHVDFTDANGNTRVTGQTVVSPNTTNLHDGHGHGTHVAGIVGGDGDLLDGKYIGIAPDSRLISVKTGDDQGRASLSDLMGALEWTFQNREAHNIRVVNLSLHSTVAESYTTDPVCAAVEALWFSGVFVVVASGNTGGVPHHCPGTDPFVMTVGATDDMGTPDMADDAITSWTTRGTTEDGFQKPEIYAPGRNIVSVADSNSILFQNSPHKVVDGSYLSLSGTSMAAPVLAGVAALAFEAHPAWTPDQLKCTLMDTSRPLTGSAGSVVSAAQVVSQSAPSTSCNQDIPPNVMLGNAAVVAPAAVIAHVLQSDDPAAAAQALGLTTSVFGAGDDVSWDAISWDAISWDAISWDAISWDAISWDAISWDAISWDAISWDAISWDAISWDAISWDAISWDAISWDAISWDAISWDAISWDAISWDAISWDAISWDAITEEPQS